ncbi:DNA-binding response regulator [Nocardia sp. MH4]|uniref:response regulator transcription factor n=1 Tax=Nocardia sp. MH4 TaxID=1768677 RepID=UPI001C4FE002|nr:response regulator transcription factor [Nocardia sp. MH4]
MTSTTTVVVVDGWAIAQQGLRSICVQSANLTLAGVASSMSAALELINRVQPDVVVIDPQSLRGEVVSTAAALAALPPNIGCLIFTENPSHRTMVSAVSRGRTAVLCKSATMAELTALVERLGSPCALLDDRLSETVISEVRRHRDIETVRLTERQRQLLAMLGAGLTNRQIAARLFLSEKTIRNAVSGLLTRLDLRNRTQAAVVAHALGLGAEDFPLIRRSV